ncbi:hypothetical protein [Stenotrophomonas sp. AB1(2024)]|uniref:hypothetical protein n=1 Tax=Stenotrophomonas sp. AB1(2024) TaxID=3132215 RepID=UPI0030B4E6B7
MSGVMHKLCIAIYMLLGAVFGLWLTFVCFWLQLWTLVGERFSVFAGIVGGLAMSSLAGYFVNFIWRRASQWQRAYLVTLGSLTIATLLGVGLIAWIYVASQRG